ncbi:hypothetical protein ACLHDD_02495 [Pantoea sp. NSTU24]
MFNPLKRIEKPHLKHALVNLMRDWSLSDRAYATASSRIGVQA